MTSMNNKKPYVLSTGMYALMKEWSENTGILIPEKKTFDVLAENIQDKLSQVFSRVDLLTEELLSEKTKKMFDKKDLPVIAVDRVLSTNKKQVVGHLDITRACTSDLTDRGIVQRDNMPHPLEQIEGIVKNLERNEIALFDDVLFSGGTIKRVINTFKDYGVSTKKVIAAVSMGDAIESLTQEGIPVESAFIYEDVIDEVCCRDFMAGFPLSGRTILTKNYAQHFNPLQTKSGLTEFQRNEIDITSNGAPYFLPYGNPQSWASIPGGYAKEFSDFCLKQSRDFWSKVETLNNFSISTSELPREVNKMNKGNSVVDVLNQAIDRLGYSPRRKVFLNNGNALAL